MCVCARARKCVSVSGRVRPSFYFVCCGSNRGSVASVAMTPPLLSWSPNSGQHSLVVIVDAPSRCHGTIFIIFMVPAALFTRTTPVPRAMSACSAKSRHRTTRRVCASSRRRPPRRHRSHRRLLSRRRRCRSSRRLAGRCGRCLPLRLAAASWQRACVASCTHSWRE